MKEGTIGEGETKRKRRRSGEEEKGKEEKRRGRSSQGKVERRKARGGIKGGRGSVLTEPSLCLAQAHTCSHATCGAMPRCLPSELGLANQCCGAKHQNWAKTGQMRGRGGGKVGEMNGITDVIPGLSARQF